MDIQKLKVRIGPHEFEAEGPKEDVAAHFEAWKELIGKASASVPPATPGRNGHGSGTEGEASNQSANQGEGGIDRIRPLFTQEDRSLTLNVQPVGDAADEDAIILLALGYKRLLGLDAPLSIQLAESLRVSGLNAGRMDRTTAPLLKSNLLLKAGRAKATKYRLTATGIVKAEEIAGELLKRL